MFKHSAAVQQQHRLWHVQKLEAEVAALEKEMPDLKGQAEAMALELQKAEGTHNCPRPGALAPAILTGL